MNASNALFGVEGSAVRLLYRLSGARPSSAPYLSGDGFRALCRLSYEGSSRSIFQSASANEGELIFVEAWHLEEFLNGPAREIARPFSVISHNGDRNIDGTFLPLLPPTLRRLFAQNALLRDPRIVPLPIGLENRRLHCNGIVGDFERISRIKRVKKPRILTAFTPATNPSVRLTAMKHLASSPANDSVSRINSRSYRELAAGYMFIASPPGNGEDCHRTWEALYMRSVPVVMRSPLTMAFKARGMPLLLVDSYEELCSWDEAKAARTYEELSPGFDSPSIWFDYWKEVVDRR